MSTYYVPGSVLGFGRMRQMGYLLSRIYQLVGETVNTRLSDSDKKLREDLKRKMHYRVSVNHFGSGGRGTAELTSA